VAQITFALGTSHGPLLVTPPEEWDLRANVDRKNPALTYRDGTYSFPELVALRGGPEFERQNTLEVRTERHAACQRHLDELARRTAEAAPDVLVIIGDDQHEWFHSDIQPAFAIFHGDKVLNRVLTPQEVEEKLAKGAKYSMKVYHPDKDEIYPCPSELGELMVRQAITDNFDVTSCAAQPHDDGHVRHLGHAYGFICRRILGGRNVPMLPVMINTYFPPNQPTAARCFEFGRSLGRAVRAWKKDAKVAVAASGGVSHFVIDEDFDGRVLDAMKARDYAALIAEPEVLYRSGSSETKNWIVLAGMLADTDLAMDLIGYVPCYRSEAGTGSGMAFATWA
jgi:OH-DDVA oxygenase/3-O-methylgallate 3,4-dioxygenase